MSVWEKTSYKLDIAKNIYETFGRRIIKILGPKASPYLHPKGELTFICNDSFWTDIACACSWALPNNDTEFLREFDAWTSNVTTWHVGTAAIYRVIYAFTHGRFPKQSQYPREAILKRLDAVASVVVSSTAISPRAFINQWKARDKAMVKRSWRYEDLSEGWKYLYRSWPVESINLDLVPMDKYFGFGFAFYEVAWARNLVVLRGKDLYSNQGLIMNKTHVSFLIESLMRISNLLDHVAREHCLNLPLRIAATRMLNLSIDCAGKAKRSNADKVVQAFHKARAFTQMIMFDNIEDRARDEAIVEFKKKSLFDVLDLADYLKIFETLPKGMWLELIHIYKWMPPPDFDATSAFEELREYHTSTRKSGLDPDASPRMKHLWQLVEKERKLNIAVAFKTTYNRWPDGLAVEGHFPTSESLDEWKPQSLFPYGLYGKDIISQIKDKSTVLPRVHLELNTKQNHPDKNFLLWFLRHYGDVDTVKAGAEFAGGQLQEDNYARVAYKGEAHKPGSRLFFMAPPVQRILLGELEGNISRIASVYPASLQGISATVRDVRLHSLFDINRPSDLADFDGATTCFVVTFDLSKFSPRFNPRVLKNLHQFWADVFGYQPIAKMSDIGAEGRILHTTNQLVMEYQNMGADLEGFRGRMMTLFHADLISAACRYATDKGFIVGRAFSAVFIDDGAVRVYAKGEGVEARRNASRFLECMQDIYEAAGQENHPNKTIVSFLGGELLSEQFLFGQKLKCPIKAAMRLYPRYEHLAATISDEFMAMFSTSQGSCKEGATWAVCYRRLAEAMMKSIYRWGRRDFTRLDPVRFALKFVTPRSMGGFGFPSLQALTSTTALDLTCEGCGILNKAANGIPSYEQLIYKIILRPVMVREPLSILRDPLRVRMPGPILVENRLINAIIRYLAKKKGPWTKFLQAYNTEELHLHAKAVAVALLSREVFSAPVCKRVWESTPLSYVESVVMKFQKSDSIQAILPEKVIQSIRKSNRRDVFNLLKVFF